MPSSRTQHHPNVPEPVANGDSRTVALAVAAAAGLVLVLLAVGLGGRHCLDGGADAGDDLFWLLSGTMAVAAGCSAVFFALRASRRVAGPERRLVLAMRRIRGGDVSFRIHLRRGDLLTPLARECNELLDWLNRNPPAGIVTGGDLVAMDGFDAAPASRAVLAVPVQEDVHP